VSRLSSPDDVQPDDAATPGEDAPVAEDAPTEEAAPVRDELRAPVIEALQAALGEAVVATEVLPGQDAWVRIRVDAWGDAARVLREDLGFTYFCFLSAIDWLPSPFGKSEDDATPAPVDPTAPLDHAVGSASEQADAERSLRSSALEHGTTGGETRFQLIARVERPGTGLGITLKADVEDASPVAPTWSNVYLGANWHERECWEMFGITFEGHPNLSHLYLPGEFEGFPLRKDFPLISRMVKPWPGLVDVEPMPGEDNDEEETAEVAAE
jgi:NADH-quinone oxidoreductase subunit C